MLGEALDPASVGGTWSMSFRHGEKKLKKLKKLKMGFEPWVGKKIKK